MVLILIIGFYFLIIYFEFKNTFKKGQSKEKIIYSILMLFQVILSIMIFFEIEIKTPVDLIEEVVIYFKTL